MYKLFIVEDDIGIAEAIKVQAEMWDLQVLSNALKYTPSGSITIKCDNDGRLFIQDTV